MDTKDSKIVWVISYEEVIAAAEPEEVPESFFDRVVAAATGDPALDD